MFDPGLFRSRRISCGYEIKPATKHIKGNVPVLICNGYIKYDL
jgi:hypothetical protein